MNKLSNLGIVAMASVAVALADVLIKKAAYGAEGFWDALKSPFMLGVLALYVIQVLAFLYVFVHKEELSIVGIIQNGLYGVIVVGAGVLFFKENISALEWIGMGLVIAGVILMNL